MRNSLTPALVALLSATVLPAQTVDDWRADLQLLSIELPARHKNAFARITRAQWDSAVTSLDARLPQLKRHETIVEFMRLVALVGDGHTALVPEFDPAIGFHRFPIQLYDFEDGLHIISADSAHADLVGAKVILIGRSSSAAAVHTAGRVISHESPNWVRARAASLLAIPEVLAALGMGRDTLTADFVIEQNAKQRTVQLKGTGSAGGDAHNAPAGQVNMRRVTPGADPLWLQQPDRTFWYTITADKTLYICHRAVTPFADGMTNEQFFRSAFAAGDSAQVERVVLDIRTNGGGNNFMNRSVVREIIRRPELDRPDKFFVLIGRGVFSAAQNLVNELDYYTNATFVGEPTGNAPNQYGDARPLDLPRSKLRIRVSSLLWQGHSASDERRWFQPDVFAAMDAGDYKLKIDPVYTAAMRRATEPSLDQRLETLAAAGDTGAVRSRIASYRDRSENKFRNVESDVNDAGYRLLRGGKIDAAVTVFQVNVAMNPRSGNAYDSLGEALERAGKNEDAVAAYRKAISLDAMMFSSRDALRRLGAAP